MKVLSTTIGEGRVLEFTREEWRELELLIASLEGKAEGQAIFDFRMRNPDHSMYEEYGFEGTFGAIAAFTQAHFRANEMRATLNRFDDYLKKKL